MGKHEYAGGELEAFSQASEWKDYFGAILRPYLGKRVLEVGAGIGSTTASLCHAGIGSWLCLDPDPSHVRILESKIGAGALPHACRALCGTLEDLEPGRVFDTILYIDVLEHIADDLKEIVRAAGHLDAGGCLAVLSPAHPWLTSDFDRAVGHHRRYTKASLAALRPEGFHLERMSYLDSAGVLLSLANRLLLNQSRPTPGQIMFWDRRVVPVSRRLDPWLRFSVGKSILAVWRRA
jgi:SAM-dependent methyltransferase